MTALAFLIGSGSQTPMFAIFGSVALLVIVDFPGNRPARAVAYGGLGFNGAVLITIGSLVAPIPWLAVTLMFVLGVAVTFSGVLSEIVAAGQRSTLLTFVLPVCTPPGPIPDRLLGWAHAYRAAPALFRSLAVVFDGPDTLSEAAFEAAMNDAPLDANPVADGRKVCGACGVVPEAADEGKGR